MLELKDFLRIAEYGNKAWKGSFTEEEVKQNAEDYLSEFNASNEKGKANHTMEELCKLLVEDIEGGSKESEEFLDDILLESDWTMEVYYCNGCNKREIVFFSEQEMENIYKHECREMLIQDALPEKPQWIRETFVSGECLCPKCWEKYWNGEL